MQLKNLIDARKPSERFRADETVEAIDLELKDLFFSMHKTAIFMDLESYEQIELATDWIGERAAFLQGGMKITLQMHGSRPTSIRFPPRVTLKIVEADPAARGQTAASSYKPAVLGNGLRVLVPPFIGRANGSSSIRVKSLICGG